MLFLEAIAVAHMAVVYHDISCITEVIPCAEWVCCTSYIDCTGWVTVVKHQEVCLSFFVLEIPSYLLQFRGLKDALPIERTKALDTS